MSQISNKPKDEAYKQNFYVNVFLYLGLGFTALGMILVALGEGEPGFRSVHLKMLGPSMIVFGSLLVLLWVLLLVLPSYMANYRLRSILITMTKLTSNSQAADSCHGQGMYKDTEHKVRKVSQGILAD